MGISPGVADVIIGAHKNRPIEGDVLLCGRQSVYFTPAELAALIRFHGLTPQISIEECELDRETRLGGEGGAQRDGEAISDRGFFRMLGVQSLTVLDHSAYEGAALLIDLNYPVASHMEANFDFIIDGGTLDNVFNPPQALMNISRMLRPSGRLLTYNMYSNHLTPYSMLPHQWYLDYFAVNQFAYAQVYFCVHEFTGDKAYYQVNLGKRASSRATIGNFPLVEATAAVATFVYAVKSAESTYDRQPSQEIYRSDDGWRQAERGFSAFAAYECKPLMRSSSPLPIVMPGGDDFQYIDIDGNLVTASNRESHDRQLRTKMVSALKSMDRMNGTTAWGILELEKPFYDMVGESAEVCAIIAKDNVILLDSRMLNQHTTIGGTKKEIYPAAIALMLDIPILVLSTEPEIDALWKRNSRYFRHTNLHAACIGDAAKYFDAGVALSPSLECGDYRGSPSACIDKVQELITRLVPSVKIDGG
jgi:hypothetical protein